MANNLLDMLNPASQGQGSTLKSTFNRIEENKQARANFRVAPVADYKPISASNGEGLLAGGFNLLNQSATGYEQQQENVVNNNASAQQGLQANYKNNLVTSLTSKLSDMAAQGADSQTLQRSAIQLGKEVGLRPEDLTGALKTVQDRTTSIGSNFSTDQVYAQEDAKTNLARFEQEGNNRLAQKQSQVFQGLGIDPTFANMVQDKRTYGDKEFEAFITNNEIQSEFDLAPILQEFTRRGKTPTLGALSYITSQAKRDSGFFGEDGKADFSKIKVIADNYFNRSADLQDGLAKADELLKGDKLAWEDQLTQAKRQYQSFEKIQSRNNVMAALGDGTKLTPAKWKTLSHAEQAEANELNLNPEEKGGVKESKSNQVENVKEVLLGKENKAPVSGPAFTAADKGKGAVTSWSMGVPINTKSDADYGVMNNLINAQPPTVVLPGTPPLTKRMDDFKEVLLKGGKSSVKKTEASTELMDKLGARESSNDYSAVNSRGYAGKYQFGLGALQDTGYKDSSGKWLGKDNINSQEDFLNNPEVQERAMKDYLKKQEGYLKAKGALNYIGKDFNGITLTKQGLLAAAHLVGAGGVSEMLKTGKVPTDANGTPATEYLQF